MKTTVDRGLGSAGRRPVPLGSLPRGKRSNFETKRTVWVAGKLPATTGWQPVLPRKRKLAVGSWFC